MTFQWPWQFDFAPFFTIQPNLAAREKQLEAWCRLIIDYCQCHKIYLIDLDEVAKSELFNNSKLNRRLDESALRIVFDYLDQKKHVEWKDKAKRRCNIYWRRPEEWGQQIYEWVSFSGFLNNIVTFYDLTQSEDISSESFYGLDKDVLLKALSILESQKKAVFVEINGEIGGSTFIRNKDLIEEGDTVIIYLNHMTLYVVVVRRGCTLNMKYGALRHEFLVGKRYGTQVSASAGYIFALRANPHFWTRTLSRQTQILYTPDIATILLLLDVRPGFVICETGTGSGSLSHAIATAIGPTGHLYSHDIEERRVRSVEKDLKLHGLNCTVVQQDACKDGFFVKNACDGVFLDLPEPWKAIGHAKLAINHARGGRIVAFSPCIEQVQKVCLDLEAHGFVQTQVIEIVPRKLKVIGVVNETLEQIVARSGNLTANGLNESNGGDLGAKKAKKRKLNLAMPPSNYLSANSLSENTEIRETMPFPFTQPTHTGYLVSASLLSALPLCN